MARRPPTHLGDMQMGHGCFPPTRNIQSSPNVLVNHRFVIRDGDIFEPHHCGWDDDGNPRDFHYPMARGDAITVFVNGRRAALFGARTYCNAMIVTTPSPDVFMLW